MRWSLSVVGTEGSLEVSRGGWGGSRGEYTLNIKTSGPLPEGAKPASEVRRRRLGGDEVAAVAAGGLWRGPGAVMVVWWCWGGGTIVGADLGLGGEGRDGNPGFSQWTRKDTSNACGIVQADVTPATMWLRAAVASRRRP